MSGCADFARERNWVRFDFSFYYIFSKQARVFITVVMIQFNAEGGFLVFCYE